MKHFLKLHLPGGRRSLSCSFDSFEASLLSGFDVDAEPVVGEVESSL